MDNQKKELRDKKLFRICFLIGYIFVSLFLGMFCFLIIVIIPLDKLSFMEAYNYVFRTKGESNESIFVRYSISHIIIFSFFSACFYGFILIWIKKWKFFRENYKALKEPIYDLLTLGIFLFGFLPLFLKFINFGNQAEFLKNIDGITVGFFISIIPPYLYAGFSKINDKIDESLMSESINSYLNKKYKK